MDFCTQNAENQKSIEHVFGYLNFSSGAADSLFLRGLDCVYRLVAESEPQSSGESPLWRRVIAFLRRLTTPAKL